MKKEHIIIVIGLLVFTAFAGGITFLFLDSFTAKGRYTPTRATPSASVSSGDHHSKSAETPNGDTAALEVMTEQKQVNMDIINNSYQHSNIEITKGTTVTWTNRDTIAHNVMEDHKNSDAVHDATTKDNVKETKFSGPEQIKGKVYSYTFNETGEVEYHCAKHPEMRGKINVINV